MRFSHRGESVKQAAAATVKGMFYPVGALLAGGDASAIVKCGLARVRCARTNGPSSGTWQVRRFMTVLGIAAYRCSGRVAQCCIAQM